MEMPTTGMDHQLLSWLDKAPINSLVPELLRFKRYLDECLSQGREDSPTLLPSQKRINQLLRAHGEEWNWGDLYAPRLSTRARASNRKARDYIARLRITQPQVHATLIELIQKHYDEVELHRQYARAAHTVRRG